MSCLDVSQFVMGTTLPTYLTRAQFHQKHLGAYVVYAVSDIHKYRRSDRGG